MENLEVMVILFIIVVLGYALCKLGYMGDKFDQKLSSIVIDVTCPALILSSVMGTELPDRSLILPLLGVGFLTYVVLLVFGFWVPRFVSKDRDEQGMIGFALMFANVGFIGYPIVSSIFGPKAVFYAALLNMPNTFFIFTAGVMLVKGEYGVKNLNPKVLLSPAMIAAFAAALLVAFSVSHSRPHSPSRHDGGQYHRACRPDGHRIVYGAPAPSRGRGQCESLCCLFPAPLRRASVGLFSVQGLWRERPCQSDQYGGHCHACRLLRHHVLHEVWAQCVADDGDDVCHHRRLDPHHTAGHDAAPIAC